LALSSSPYLGVLGVWIWICTQFGATAKAGVNQGQAGPAYQQMFGLQWLVFPFWVLGTLAPSEWVLPTRGWLHSSASLFGYFKIIIPVCTKP
jgi:hypothetical protein